MTDTGVIPNIDEELNEILPLDIPTVSMCVMLEGTICIAFRRLTETLKS